MQEGVTLLSCRFVTFQFRTFPVCKRGAGLVRAFEEAQQFLLRVLCLTHVVVHQQEFFQFRVVESRRWADVLSG